MAASQKSAVFKDVEEISQEDCLNIAKLKMKSTNVEVVNVTMKTLGDTPAGFGGDHYRLKITVLKNRKEGEEMNDSDLVDLHFFVKTKPRDSAHSDFIDRMGVIKRELDFFSIVMVLLHKYISNEKDDSPIMQVPWTPKCYLANMKLIVLDDLSHEEYSVLENRATMNYDHCVVMFETIARFHASSIIFEEKESQDRGKPFRFNEDYPDVVKENTWTYDPPGNAGKQMCDASVYGFLSLIKIMPQLKQDPRKFELVQNATLNMFRDVNNLVAASTEFRNVLTHGDLWANNIMFKYDSTGKKPIAARIIDFQLLRYTVPAHDFLCALYLNTGREFREKHLLEMASVYHTTVAAELARYQLDINKLMPWDEFKRSLEHYRILALLTDLSYFPSVLMPKEVATVVFGDTEKLNKYIIDDQSEWTCLSYQTDTLFRERINEVVDELIEYLLKIGN